MIHKKYSKAASPLDALADQEQRADERFGSESKQAYRWVLRLWLRRRARDLRSGNTMSQADRERSAAHLEALGDHYFLSVPRPRGRAQHDTTADLVGDAERAIAKGMMPKDAIISVVELHQKMREAMGEVKDTGDWDRDKQTLYNKIERAIHRRTK